MRYSEPKRFNVTPAVRRAMIATNDQKVFRIYGPNGSAWKCERNGVSPRMLWKLLANELIEDEPQTAVTIAVPATIRMRLSKVGLDILKASLDGKA
ncbi:hypothetical protein BCCGELA001_26070 [Bradyrhizobium sp. CCGE-LA001]|nr:hypothetical protein BCCGELA001_26070 [Bradyrhizobium sp. CCGE-LA001]KYG98430.1 hypothetical protein SE91_07805 [Bradyrhizobium sp. DOA1]